MSNFLTVAQRSKFIDMQQQIQSCRLCDNQLTPCPILFGKQNAKIMQISQAPSKTVAQTGLPFSDASGKILRNQWYQIKDSDFYNPDFFYITSMAHCYPGKSTNGGDNKPPKMCTERWLKQEVALVQNQLYIIIGSYAANYFFPKTKLTELVFQDLTINNLPAYVLPHPSPLNRRWLKQNPTFITERLPIIRGHIQKIIS